MFFTPQASWIETFSTFDWKTQLESLTDQQLVRLNVDDICAGLLDRAARLRKAYLAELSRRAI
jgi:hypothetical protein